MPLDSLMMWLGVVPHFRTDFGPFGTSFTKFGTFFTKFGTSLKKKKNWYIQSLSYWDPYIITHDLLIPLEIFGKWLEAIPYFEMDFGTPRYILEKFDTSNPWANGTPISFAMVYFIFWSCSLPQNGLWNPWFILYKIWHIHKKIWYIQSLSY